MSRYFSDKLTILYTVLIVMVLYIHSTYAEALQYPVAAWIQRFFNLGICRGANCLFFCISGYLFCRNIESVKDIWIKQKKRVRTLLVPYIIWNVIFVLWYVVLENLPYINTFVSGEGGTLSRYLSLPLRTTLYELFIAPVSFPLWFLRDLIVMIAFIPIIWWITKKQWLIALIMALGSVVVYHWFVYFWIGVAFAVYRVDIENYPPDAKLTIL